MNDPNQLTVLVRLRARDGQAEEVASTVRTQLARIRGQEPACLDIAVHQSRDDPHRFMLFETWSDQASFDEFVTTRPHMLEYLERLGALLEDREMTMWRAIG
jgi:quinol monooxygenase YgiN